MYFLITIDTEGDNIWASPRDIKTENAKFLPRFQSLCEKYRLKPTYLTNYEMAVCPVYQEFARDYLNRNTAELGMHLHAWNSPPLHELTEDDYLHKPYLIEYPDDFLVAKVKYITELLENQFGIKLISHRAGRWAFNELYAKTLLELGYEVDCSVTPGVTWEKNMGNPKGEGGSDYRNFPTGPYFLNLNNLSQESHSGLLELPVSILPKYTPTVAMLRRKLNKLKGKEKPDAAVWLRPSGRNLRAMLKILDRAKRDQLPYVEFILHSSEFMPGGSPTFKTEEQIERLYDDLESLFKYVAGSFQGATLAEFNQIYRSKVSLNKIAVVR